MAEDKPPEPEEEENKLANEKFSVKLVKEYIFIVAEIKGKKIKCSPNKKILYPFDK